VFLPETVAEVARWPRRSTARTENIGARRLHTLMERLLEEVLFEARGHDGLAGGRWTRPTWKAG